MAVFTDEEIAKWGWDWQLLQNGPVALFHKPAVFDEAAGWLAEHGYRVASYDAGTWAGKEDCLLEILRGLGFPPSPHPNLNAFNDYLSQLEIPDAGGVAIAFHRYDSFARQGRHTAQQILDIIADNARGFLLRGRRLLALVQSDDPELDIEPVGASPVSWNPKEWLRSDRGV